MAKRDEQARQKRSEEMEREMTKKEERLRAREREQHRTLYIAVGISIGLAVLAIIIGLVFEFFVRPNRTVATVDETRIVARDFWKRTRLEENQLRNALVFYQLQEQQFGGQGIFTQQINQLQATLASPFALGQQTIDQMVEEAIISREAAARGITVSAEEIDAALREEVASARGAVTEAQATATAEAGATATAEAAAATPAATATSAATDTAAVTDTASVTDTATVTVAPTSEPLPTPVVITDTGFTEGLEQLGENLRNTAGMSMEDYRQVVAARLLRDKLEAEIGSQDVATTEEQVRARHILIRDITPTPEPTAVPEGQPTPEPTATATPLPAGAPTPTPTPGPRTREESQALALELKGRIEAGEDFATLAAEYSDDLSNAAEGGDLGWFGRGTMVGAFEEAAFALPVGQVSEPISTTFGTHLILVDEKDAERPLDEATVNNLRTSAFDTWLQEQVAASVVERMDVEGNLPRQLQ